MSFDITGLEMLDILLDHFLLGFIGAVLPGLFQVHLGLFEVWFEFTVFQMEGLALENDAVLRFVSVNTSNSDNIFLSNFESSSVKNINSLGKKESLNQSKIILGHISGEIAGNTTLFWEVQLGERLLEVEDLLLNLRVELVNDLSIEAVLIIVEWVGREDLVESLSGQVWDEFVVAEVVVVTEVAVETCNVGDELSVVRS